MKKIILIFTVIIFLNGCTSNIRYDFTNDNISSSININITLDEFITYYKDNYLEVVNDISYNDGRELLNSFFDTTNVRAYKNNIDTIYDLTEITENNNNYDIKYKFDYNYFDFKDNYILNDCFDSFVSYDDDNAYYYQISGNYKCTFDNNLKFIVSSEYDILNSNEDVKENNLYIWNVSNEKNDIYFAISKKDNVKKSNILIKIASVFVILLLVISSVFVIILKKRDNL